MYDSSRGAGEFNPPLGHRVITVVGGVLFSTYLDRSARRRRRGRYPRYHRY